MRILIRIVSMLMIVFTINVIVYSTSEDYRFFLKKLKYEDQTLVESREEIISQLESTQNSNRNTDNDIDTLKDKILGRETIDGASSAYTFIEMLGGRSPEGEQEEELPELTYTQERFVELFDGFDLQLLESPSSLFGITTEYPDPYYDYFSDDLSLYVFPTKNYDGVSEIFEVLQFELPYTINEVDNFGQASFYINLDNAYRDDIVRLVLKHKNKAFGLKIKKDRYNSVKEILERDLPEL